MVLGSWLTLSKQPGLQEAALAARSGRQSSKAGGSVGRWISGGGGAVAVARRRGGEQPAAMAGESRGVCDGARIQHEQAAAEEERREARWLRRGGEEVSRRWGLGGVEARPPGMEDKEWGGVEGGAAGGALRSAVVG